MSDDSNCCDDECLTKYIPALSIGSGICLGAAAKVMYNMDVELAQVEPYNTIIKVMYMGSAILTSMGILDGMFNKYKNYRMKK